MSEAHRRLKRAREAAGFVKAAEAADAFGWSYSTYAGHENGSRGVTPEAAEKYARSFRTSAEWILFGTGPEAAVELDETPPKNLSLVPVYDVAASAGGGHVNEYEPQTHSLAFPPDYLQRLTSSSPKNLAIISVKGDSMEPTLLDDDIVLLDQSKTNLGYDGLFVLRIDDVLHVKRVGRSSTNGFVKIISDNPNQENFDREIKGISTVGKVLWYGRKV